MQVFTSRKRPGECYTGQVKDISRSGIFFHSDVALDSCTDLELTFSLPSERESTSVLVRASAKALRVSELAGDAAPAYGVAATIDRIDFIRPLAVNAA